MPAIVNIANLDQNVLHALKAYKVEKGMSASAAAAWAAANLTAGVARVKAVLAQHRIDPETGSEEAFVSLKEWAQSS